MRGGTAATEGARARVFPIDRSNTVDAAAVSVAGSAGDFDRRFAAEGTRRSQPLCVGDDGLLTRHGDDRLAVAGETVGHDRLSAVQRLVHERGQLMLRREGKGTLSLPADDAPLAGVVLLAAGAVEPDPRQRDYVL